MANKPARNRVRRSSCELCEPRQMLSVTPVVPLDVQLVNQSIGWQLMSNVTLVKLDAGWSIQDPGSGIIAIHADTVFFNALNGYGIAGHLSVDASSIPAVNQGFPRNQNDWGPAGWQIAKTPQLDPIPISPPKMAPIRISADDAEMVSQPVRAPSAIDEGDMPTSSSAPIWESPKTIATERSVGDIHDSAKPNWLSVTFSQDERHRLDANTVDAHFEHTIAARDPKARFALEPTRVMCQTFCDPVAAPFSDRDDAAESSELPASKPVTAGDATQPLETSPHRTTSATIAPTIRDAAILDWETSHAAVLAAPVVSTRPSQRRGGRQESSIDAGDEFEENETAANSTVAQFLDENKYLAGVLLGVLASRSLWSYGARADSQSAGATVKLLRKRLATNG